MLHLTQNTACLLHFVQFGQFRVKSLCHCNQTAQEFAWNQTETTVLRHSQTRQDPYLSKHNYRGCSTRVPFKLTKLSTCNELHNLLVVALFSLGPATTCHTITAACSWPVNEMAFCNNRLLLATLCNENYQTEACESSRPAMVNMF